MREGLKLVVAALLIGMLTLACPAHALKVYLNPSIQTGNYSPDGAYQEGSNMQDVATRLSVKLINRGIQARSSGWMDLGPACTDSNNWRADCFVAIHTDSTGAGGWTGAHGSRGFFHQSSSGWHDDRNIDFAAHIVNKMVSKFNAFGRGYNLGTQADYPWCGWNMYVIAPWNQVAVPSALIEGLYHDNYDDVYGVLLKPEGRDAYAQGVFEGICDYYGWNPVMEIPVGPSVIANADGRLQVFSHSSDNHIWTCVQTAVNANTFSAWSDMGGSIKGRVSPAINSDGRIEVFAMGTDNALWHCWQNTAGGSWSGWGSLGGSLKGCPAAIKNVDGRIDCHIVAADGHLKHIWQNTAGGSWSAWSDLGGNLQGTPTAILNKDGRIEVFVRGADRAAYRVAQTSAGGGWNTISSVGGDLAYDMSAAINTDGRVDVYALGWNGHIYHNWQTTAGGSMSSWNDMGGIPVAFDGIAAAGRNADGRLTIHARGVDGNVYNNWQTTAGGGWNGWVSLGGATAVANVALTNSQNGRMDSFVWGTSGQCYHKYQTSVGGGWNSNGWESMGGGFSTY